MTKTRGKRKNEPLENTSPKSAANILFFPDISKFPASKNNEKYIKVAKILVYVIFFV